MNTPKGVIFDMDGVIVDSEPIHEQAFREVFDQLGYGERHGVHFPDYYGKSDLALWLDFVARHQPPQSLEDLSQRKQTRFLTVLRGKQPIFEGLPELVARAAARWPIAVASGSSHPVIDAVLAMRDLRRHFTAVVSVQDVARGKPAPDVFLRAAELIRVPPENCWVIEDAEAGVAAARAAGMRVIAITNSLPAERLAAAHHVISSYGQLANLLFDPAESPA